MTEAELSGPPAASDRASAGSGFTQVRARRGPEQVAEQIREAILARRYKPGDRLPTEREMAEIFGVSRNGIREAMRSLESSGLVEVRLGSLGGVFVGAGDPGMVARSVSDLASLGALSPDSILEARILLTSDVLRLACERATEEDLQRIEQDIVLTEQHFTESGAERITQITEFYRLLAAATHNEVLVILTNALTQAVHARLMRAGPAVDRNVGRLRRRIIGYIRANDPDAAIDAIARHLNRLERSMRAAERQREQP
jgi:DNA-binding FadR family transcriptional regulator